jgi:hypothetical protein
VTSWAGRFGIIDQGTSCDCLGRRAVLFHATTLHATPDSVNAVAPLHLSLVWQGVAGGAGTWPGMLPHHLPPPLGGRVVGQGM